MTTWMPICPSCGGSTIGAPARETACRYECKECQALFDAYSPEEWAEMRQEANANYHEWLEEQREYWKGFESERKAGDQREFLKFH